MPHGKDLNPSIHIPLSVLDLAPILEGYTPTNTFRNSLHLAQAVEQEGFRRYWFAEHHNMDSVASSATVVLIGHIAGGTSRLRVGSGGIMLPNHAPLVVAEQFGTLASIYPGRIDLGLGRAPGTDGVTAQALRRHSNGADFGQEILELQHYFSAGNRNGQVRAIPGEGLDVPIWILGSSTDSAMLAAAMGLPYAFAAHFAPTQLHHALSLYRERFRPSAVLDAPYAMPCVNVVAAGTDAAAERLATSFYQFAQGIFSGRRRPLQAPVDSMNGLWTVQEETAIRQMGTYSFVGGPARVQKELQAFIDATQADELMVVSHIYEPAARVESYRVLAGLDLQRPC